MDNITHRLRAQAIQFGPNGKSRRLLTEAADEIDQLREVLDGLVDAVEAHNKANGKIMVDPHALTDAKAALGAMTGEARG